MVLHYWSLFLPMQILWIRIIAASGVMAILGSTGLTTFIDFPHHLAEVILLAYSIILATGGPEYLVRVPNYHSLCDTEDTLSDPLVEACTTFTMDFHHNLDF